jgi:hypothetical protein
MLQIEKNPLETAISQVKEKNKQLAQIIATTRETGAWSSPFSMALNGNQSPYYLFHQ